MALESDNTNVKDDDSGLEPKTVAILVAIAFVAGTLFGVAILPLIMWLVRIAFWTAVIIAIIGLVYKLRPGRSRS
ncbi:MAG TPA: hypothetical protein VK694_02020 [Verrucomicrobiae bacterium]|nr:hypothetical protein [Verrucomicrobiae bacterium]